MSRSFDGTDDVVQSSYVGVGGSGARTYCVWFKTSASGSIVYHMSYGGNSGTAVAVTASVESGVIWMRFFGGVTWSYGSGYADGNWHFLGWSYPGGALNTSIVFVDGSVVSPTYGSGTTTLNTGNNVNFRIGTDNGAANDWSGNLAHSHFYSINLTSNEMFQIMRLPGSIKRSLQIYWPLLGSSPEPDYSGNGNNGTVTGATVSPDNPPISGIFHVPSPAYAV